MAKGYGSAARVQAAEKIASNPAEDEVMGLDDLGDMPEDMPEDMPGAVDVSLLVEVASDFGKSEQEAMDLVPLLEAYMAASAGGGAPEAPAAPADEMDLPFEEMV